MVRRSHISIDLHSERVTEALSTLGGMNRSVKVRWICLLGYFNLHIRCLVTSKGVEISIFYCLLFIMIFILFLFSQLQYWTPRLRRLTFTQADQSMNALSKRNQTSSKSFGSSACCRISLRSESTWTLKSACHYKPLSFCSKERTIFPIYTVSIFTSKGAMKRSSSFSLFSKPMTVSNMSDSKTAVAPRPLAS